MDRKVGILVESSPQNSKAFLQRNIFSDIPLVNKQLDPENSQFLMETSLPTPICQGLC